MKTETNLNNVRILRQAFFVASLLIILGYILAIFIHPYFELLPLLVAAGLMFSALSGFCPMAFILSKMPWNANK